MQKLSSGDVSAKVFLKCSEHNAKYFALKFLTVTEKLSKNRTDFTQLRVQ